MKTAVSIPNDVFARAERLAKKIGRSRSAIYAQALEEYMLRHGSDEVTDAMNATVDRLRDDADDFSVAAGRRVLSATEW